MADGATVGVEDGLCVAVAEGDAVGSGLSVWVAVGGCAVRVAVAVGVLLGVRGVLVGLAAAIPAGVKVGRGVLVGVGMGIVVGDRPQPGTPTNRITATKRTWGQLDDLAAVRWT